uniref:Phosphatidic acid phosphatase type 2/haloperoxidase domain-containing protein n=1 Tax=Biomphalaria glabrata TaxID=6526 RepID=A0A2C9LUF0_BIOGL
MADLPVTKNSDKESSPCNKSMLAKKSVLSVQFLCDCLLFTILGIALLLIRSVAEPHFHGFWCGDKSLSLPYKKDTVTTSLLLVTSLGGSFLMFAINENLVAVVEKGPFMGLKNVVFIQFKTYSIFFFGFIIDVMFVDAIKNTFGRQRPHFFDVCKPDVSQSNCTDTNGLDRWD